MEVFIKHSELIEIQMDFKTRILVGKFLKYSSVDSLYVYTGNIAVVKQ